MACDAKVLDEDPDTGAKRYRYGSTGPDHYSLGFTYARMALGGMSMPVSPEQMARIAGAFGW